jgi:hypothetical protein
MSSAGDEARPEIGTMVPHSARIWNYSRRRPEPRAAAPETSTIITPIARTASVP